MSVEVNPVGYKCNLSCTYCYQNPIRDAGNFTRPYDLEKMFAAIEAEGSSFTVFGGEPLLTPIDDLEKLFAFGFQKYGRNGVQTNGALITDAHIALFKKYRVYVGFSLDGPDALNNRRWSGSEEKTNESTRRSHAALHQLLADGVACSIITTLTQSNASAEHLPALLDWYRELDRLGLRSARLHLLEIDHELVGQHDALSDDENIAALLAFAKLQKELTQLQLDLFSDMRKLLQGQDNGVSCIWTGCDTYNTQAVRGIDGNGTRSNCGRVNKEGVPWAKAESRGFERYLSLYVTPQEHGGCQGCRFFLMCKGQCPGTAERGDWRNKSSQCAIWFRLFEHLEQEMLAAGETPLSLSDRRLDLEQRMLAGWAQGLPTYMYNGASSAHGDAPHGDAPHGDSHGDSPHGDA